MRSMDIPAPAPGEDRHRALALANSRLSMPSGVVDLLGDPAAGIEWLVGHGLAPADGMIGEPCAARLRAFRESTRGLLAAYTSQTAPDPADLAAVNTALTTMPAAALLEWDAGNGPHRTERLSADRLADTAIARLAAETADLLTGSDAPSLAACGSPGCTRFFLRTHAARQWCGTRCGDRVRAARHYAKRTGRDEQAATGASITASTTPA